MTFVEAPKSEYTLRIHTNTHAGNFERELCGYVTGQIGDCEVGGDEAAIAIQELQPRELDWFEDNVDKYSDEHGCARPCDVSMNVSGKGFNSVDIYLGDAPPFYIWERIVARVQKYFSHNGVKGAYNDSAARVKVLSIEIVKSKVTVTREVIRAHKV